MTPFPTGRILIQQMEALKTQIDQGTKELRSLRKRCDEIEVLLRDFQKECRVVEDQAKKATKERNP